MKKDTEKRIDMVTQNGEQIPARSGACRVVLEDRNNYLYARASGLRCQESAKALSMKVFQTALEKRMSAVLIDIRELEGYFGYMDIFLFVKSVLIDMREKGVERAALIDIHRSAHPGWFLEPVAHMYGLNIRVFADEKTALEWLFPSSNPADAL
jgi:hypothetical protein